MSITDENMNHIQAFHEKNEQQITGIISNFETQYNKFMEDTESESILQIILRAHLYIEYELTEILSQTLTYPQELGTNLSFNLKLKLLLALDAIPLQLKQPITYMNTLRNKFAHELGYQFHESMYIDFFNMLAGKLKNSHLKLTNESLSKQLRDLLCSLWIELIDLRLINQQIRKDLEGLSTL